MLGEAEKRELGMIARKSLTAAVNGLPYAPAAPAEGLPALMEKRGCFVTLRTHGALRGCLGCFVSNMPLYQTVAEYARHSALNDPRFSGSRLKPDELAEVEMEISVLTPLEPCRDPEKIELGKHGIYVNGEGGSGCFLPQVATEMNWSVEDYWGYCCRDKAGLAWDAWRQPETDLMTFTAEVFSV